jgi:mannose-6-phosphate isomerase-like protein (cupin superfamily)
MKVEPRVVQLDEVAPVPCPCGEARRAFAGSAGHALGVHLVEIQKDSRTHYHRRTTEVYLVLEGEGHVELDGQLFPVKPMTAVYIPPGCRHRAIGPLKIVNIPVPPFDPQDEWTD